MSCSGLFALELCSRYLPGTLEEQASKRLFVSFVGVPFSSLVKDPHSVPLLRGSFWAARSLLAVCSAFVVVFLRVVRCALSRLPGALITRLGSTIKGARFSDFQPLLLLCIFFNKEIWCPALLLVVLPLLGLLLLRLRASCPLLPPHQTVPRRRPVPLFRLFTSGVGSTAVASRRCLRPEMDLYATCKGQPVRILCEEFQQVQ